MFDNLRADLARYFAYTDGPPVSRASRVKSLLGTQGVWAIATYRFGRWTYGAAPRAVRPLCKLAYQLAAKGVELATGIQIPASARIGKGLYIGHFGGIVVHPETVIGERCDLAHGVTIGVLGGPRPGVPRIGNGVYLASGCKVLGAITVGDGATVGANAVVLKDVPAGATAVGVPARVVEKQAKLSSLG
jgi:serine O-acetyltransferase